MIIAVSIVDRHKYDAANPGAAHVGTYMFEVPEVDARASHYSIEAFQCEAAAEERLRNMVPLNKLLDRKAMLTLGPCMNGHGKDVSE